jgi:hypothetical protein
LPKEIGNMTNLVGILLQGNNIQISDLAIMRHWVTNLSPSVIRKLKESITPTTNITSQLRRF